MKNSTKFIIALIIIALIALIAAFIFAGRDEGPSEEAEAEDPGLFTEQEYAMPEEEMVLEDDPTTKDYDNGISFDEETEDAEITYKDSGVSDFFGSWEATSGQSAYYYGNVELKINADETWTGNITDEKLKGKWKQRDGGIYLTSEIFNCTLKFSSDGNLLMQEDYVDDPDQEGVIVLLTRK